MENLGKISVNLESGNSIGRRGGYRRFLSNFFCPFLLPSIFYSSSKGVPKQKNIIDEEKSKRREEEKVGTPAANGGRSADRPMAAPFSLCLVLGIRTTPNVVQPPPTHRPLANNWPKKIHYNPVKFHFHEEKTQYGPLKPSKTR